MANGQRSACDNCDFRWSEIYTAEMIAFEHSDSELVKGDIVTVTLDTKSYTGSLDNLEVLVSESKTNCRIVSDRVRKITKKMVIFKMKNVYFRSKITFLYQK